MHTILIIPVLITLMLQAAICTAKLASKTQDSLTLTLTRKPFPFIEPQNLIQLSKSRALSFRRRPPPLTKDISAEETSRVPIRSPLIRAFSAFYYTEIYVGTPPQKVNLLVDTGSSPTWVQSALCQECFPVSIPNFNPNRSVTYQSMPFNHPLCVPLWLFRSGQSCSYIVSYMDNEVTKGDFGLDSFTLFPTESGDHQEQATKIPDVAFGCGVHNNITALVGDAHHMHPISGILGLGRDHPSSFLLQQSQITLRKFSYCLPLNIGGHSSLIFGNDAELQANPLEIQTTPILGPSNDLYYLNLTGISLNGSLLPIDSTLFVSEGYYGVVIDSGSDYSFFVPKAYEILRQAVVNYFSEAYSWAPLSKSRSEFNLCYDIRDEIMMREGKLRGWFFPVAPQMIFHFQGANLVLNESTAFRVFEQFNEMCMMIMPSEGSLDPSIFGAFQQINHRFLFDVAASKLSFAPEKC